MRSRIKSRQSVWRRRVDSLKYTFSLITDRSCGSEIISVFKMMPKRRKESVSVVFGFVNFIITVCVLSF